MAKAAWFARADWGGNEAVLQQQTKCAGHGGERRQGVVFGWLFVFHVSTREEIWNRVTHRIAGTTTGCFNFIARQLLSPCQERRSHAEIDLSIRSG
jgi:hypothetical protein